MKSKKIITLLLISIFSVASVTSASAESVSKGQATLISEEKVILTSNKLSQEKAVTQTNQSKQYNLKILNDKGFTVYDFGAVDPEYTQSAMNYITKLTGDARIQSAYDGTYKAGNTYHLDEYGYDTDSMNFAWIDFNANQSSDWLVDWIGRNFHSGTSALYNGSNSVNYIVLNTNISFTGLGFSASWPASMTVSSSQTSASWKSDPMYGSTVVGATIPYVYVNSSTSATFANTGDVYSGNIIYRPTCYIMYN